VSDIASKWNARYAYDQKEFPSPASLLQNEAAYLPNSGNALDLACGRGGNALFLAQHGFQVDAWDISETAINQLKQSAVALKLSANLNAVVRDVVEQPPPADSFDVIVVSRFLHRPLSGSIVDALLPGGVLYYQTFTAGLSNPNYLLTPGELRHLFRDLDEKVSLETDIDSEGFATANFIGTKPLD